MGPWSDGNAHLLALGALAYWIIGAVLTAVTSFGWIAAFVVWSSVGTYVFFLLRDLLGS